MQHFSIAPIEMVASLWRNRYLIKTSIQREVVGRYRGSLLGILWSFFNPIFMLAVYTFVFSVVFKARWHAGSDSKTEFALILFAGLMVFNLFAECVNRAPGLILSNTNYVKKVIFPLEILPWVSFGRCIISCISKFFGVVNRLYDLIRYTTHYPTAASCGSWAVTAIHSGFILGIGCAWCVFARCIAVYRYYYYCIVVSFTDFLFSFESA